MKISFATILFLLCGVIISSCNSNSKKSTQVVLWQLSDPQTLNPILAGDVGSYDLNNNIFQPLVNFDYRTLKLVPVLAEKLPDVQTDSSGNMHITYELRKDARWDNGTPVTARDAEFTLKTIKSPTVNDEALKTFYDKVTNVILYPDDPLKFTIIYSEKYILAVVATGSDTYIIPEYKYDPNKYLESFTFQQLNSDTTIANNPKMVAFGKEFNSEKYSRDTNYVSGSGAYRLVSWSTGQQVVLQKKDNWWGDNLKGNNCYFDAIPSKLIYRTINDMTSAIAALKAGNVDVVNYLRPADFDELRKSEKFLENFNVYSPLRLSYTYIGLNMSDPKFSDLHTRQAIAHLIDASRIINDVFYGYAQSVSGPVSPVDSLDYDFTLKPFEFNIDTAKALLAKAGWKDNDGDGVLDKVINGKKVDFTIDYLFNTGNEQRAKVGQMFKEEARNVGIEVNILPQQPSIYFKSLKTHHFEMFMSVWTFQPCPMDFKQLFYSTEAYKNGSNFTCFGNPESDALIDSIRAELDAKKRAPMVKRLEQIVHNECGCIFICAQQATVAINKKYSNAYPSCNTPYYWEAGFDASGSGSD